MTVWPKLPRTAEDASARLMHRLVERTVFHSDDYPEKNRVRAYQQLSPRGRLTALGSPFRVHAVSYALDGLFIHLFDNVPHRFERSRAQIERDRVDVIAFQHLFEGDAAGDFDGRPMEAGEGSVYVIDFARPVVVAESRPVRLMLVVATRALALKWLGDPERLHGRVIAPGEAIPYTDCLHEIAAGLETLARDEASRVAERLMSALSRAVDATDGAVSRERAVVLRARHYVDAHLGDHDLTPQRVADALKMSRTTVYRLFEAEGGVERFIFGRRLAHVHAALTDPAENRTLSDLAERCGFANPDHFGRLFRRAYGISPSEMRARARSGGGV